MEFPIREWEIHASLQAVNALQVDGFRKTKESYET